MFFLDLSESVISPFHFRLSQKEWKSHYMGTFSQDWFPEDSGNAFFPRELLEKAQMPIPTPKFDYKSFIQIYKMVEEHDIEKMEAEVSALYKHIAKQIITKGW